MLAGSYSGRMEHGERRAVPLPEAQGLQDSEGSQMTSTAIIDWQRRALAERDAEILRLESQIAAMTASHRGA